MFYFVCDHAGYQLKKDLIQLLNQDLQFENFEFVDLTPDLVEGDDYPDSAEVLAQKLKFEPDSFGLAVCGSGQGICMALNRFPWVRAGIGYDLESAEMMRRHNQANVLCLSGKKITSKLAFQMLSAFLGAVPDTEERHLRRIKKLEQLNLIK